MCNICERAADAVAQTTNGTLKPEDVIRIVRAFREESERIESLPDMPAREVDLDAPGLDELTQALGLSPWSVSTVALGLRPYVLIEAEVLGGADENGDVSVSVTATCGGGITDKGSVDLLTKALKQVKAATE